MDMKTESKNRKIAILLHGPTCMGKSTVARLLLGGLAPVILDQEWAVGERRYLGGPKRYEDLRSDESLIVFELGCGEPLGLPFPGATRGALEWRQLLESENRKLFAFLLWSDWSDVERRVRERGENIEWARGWYDLYVQKDDRVTFPSSVRIRQHKIVTSGKTPMDVANDISQIVTGSRPFLRLADVL
jgi:hypothetical protein